MSTNRLAFRGLCMQHGYNGKRLAAEIGLREAMLSDRIGGRTAWRWPEVLAVCRALDITPDEFARYFPS